MDGTTNAPDAETTSNSGVGSSGVESPSLGFSDHPSYLVAADIHSINNGQGSILNLSNWGSDVASVGVGMNVGISISICINISVDIGDRNNIFGCRF